MKFNNEMKIITDPQVRAFVEFVFRHVPDKFWALPASSTGKYHPRSSQGVGGLVRHTKQVFWIAHALIQTMDNEEYIDSNTVLAACLLHDAWKYDERSNYTVKKHAAKAANEIRNLVIDNNYFKGNIPAWYYTLLECVQAHNGKFTTEWSDSMTSEQWIVHAADYLASRKFLVYEEV